MDADDESVDDTVMLTRRVRRQRRSDVADPDAQPDGEDEVAVDERTVVMDRRRSDAEPDESDSGIDDSTHLIEDRTVAIARRRRKTPESAGGDLEERTVVVERRKRKDVEPADADEPASTDESLYETVRRPPAEAASDQHPAIYKPRAAPRAPHRPPTVAQDIAPTRVIDARVASVTKASRRRSIVAVAAVGGASVVSLVGLVLLALFVFI